MRHIDQEKRTSSLMHAQVVAHKLHDLGLGSIKSGTSLFERAKETAKVVAPILGLSEEIDGYIELMPQGECLPEDQRTDLIELTQGVVEDTFIWFTHAPIIRLFPCEFCEEVLGMSWGTQEIDFTEAIVIDVEAKTCTIIDWSMPPTWD